MLRMVQINNLYDSSSRRRKLLIRFSILSLTAFFVSQVIPTLAEEQDRSAELQSQIAPSDTRTALTDSQTAIAIDPSESSTASTSPEPVPSPTYTPAALTPGQGMALEIPQSVSVDPRAQVVSIPRLRISGPATILACLSSSNAVADLISKGSPDDQPASNLYLDGDLTSLIAISGPTEFVNSALNSAGGIRVSGLGRKLPGTAITIAVVSIDKMADSPELCTKASPSNIRTIHFDPLGLGIGFKKGQVKLD